MHLATLHTQPLGAVLAAPSQTQDQAAPRRGSVAAATAASASAAAAAAASGNQLPQVVIAPQPLPPAPPRPIPVRRRPRRLDSRSGDSDSDEDDPLPGGGAIGITSVPRTVSAEDMLAGGTVDRLQVQLQQQQAANPVLDPSAGNAGGAQQAPPRTKWEEYYIDQVGQFVFAFLL